MTKCKPNYPQATQILPLIEEMLKSVHPSGITCAIGGGPDGAFDESVDDDIVFNYEDGTKSLFSVQCGPFGYGTNEYEYDADGEAVAFTTHEAFDPANIAVNVLEERLKGFVANIGIYLASEFDPSPVPGAR